ncbi:hypothetical protein J2X53_000806 [Pseudorhodobacter sp. 4114]|nr:hypothetical protein [Pseudorhodobacter sp. 4114]
MTGATADTHALLTERPFGADHVTPLGKGGERSDGGAALLPHRPRQGPTLAVAIDRLRLASPLA